jgi:hypothetical protein
MNTLSIRGMKHKTVYVLAWVLILAPIVLSFVLLTSY